MHVLVGQNISNALKHKGIAVILECFPALWQRVCILGDPAVSGMCSDDRSLALPASKRNAKRLYMPDTARKVNGLSLNAATTLAFIMATSLALSQTGNINMPLV